MCQKFKVQLHGNPEVLETSLNNNHTKVVSLNFYKSNFRMKGFIVGFGRSPDVSMFLLEWYLSAGRRQRGQQSTSSSQNQHVAISQSTEKQPSQPATTTTVNSTVKEVNIALWRCIPTRCCWKQHLKPKPQTIVFWDDQHSILIRSWLIFPADAFRNSPTDEKCGFWGLCCAAASRMQTRKRN